MYTEFHVKADELTEDFIKGLKSIFKNRKIFITVEEDKDETEYLLSSEANKKMLYKSLQEADKDELISVNIGKKKK